MHDRCMGGQTSEAWLASEQIAAPKMLDGCEGLSFAFHQGLLPTTGQHECIDHFCLRQDDDIYETQTGQGMPLEPSNLPGRLL
jgi:hypothetical protein